MAAQTSSKSHKLFNLLFKAGFFDALHALWPSRLTVLAYHRIADVNAPDFDTFKPNVSATPQAFAEQMDFIQQRFNVISMADLLAWLRGQNELPTKPALITFDDGYRDNLENALPVLQQRKLPATIFLATDYMGQDTPFYWDLIAYCFYHTTKTTVNLPLLANQQWADEKSRERVMLNWLGLLKDISDDDKWRAVKKLPELLDVTIPANTFAPLHLTWDEVRTMVNQGIEMGAHTQSHPILTRVPLEQARLEIEGSKKRIEAEIAQPINTMAYTNGTPADFNLALQQILANIGIDAAFTLVPGPTRLAQAQQQPMAIRRIFTHHKDSLPRFAAKIMGLPKLLKRLG